MEEIRRDSDSTSSTNIVIIGKRGVGKSSILNQIGSASSSVYKEGVDIFKHGLEVNTAAGRVIISELSLPSPFNGACLLNTIRAHAYILVYGVDDYESFDFVENVKDFLVAHKGEGVSILVVGNKSDIAARTVLYEIADCTVTIEWEMGYLETSAVTGKNVLNILPTLLKYEAKQDTTAADLETYEFKGVTFQRGAGSSKSMRSFRSSIMGNIFSRSKSRSVKDPPRVDADEPPRKFGFAFWKKRSRKSCSRRTECAPDADPPSSLVQLLDCVEK